MDDDDQVGIDLVDVVHPVGKNLVDGKEQVSYENRVSNNWVDHEDCKERVSDDQVDEQANNNDSVSDNRVSDNWLRSVAIMTAVFVCLV